MTIDLQRLQRYNPSSSAVQAAAASTPRPPADADVGVIGLGNSGEAFALALHALFYADGSFVPTLGINNDALAPRALPTRAPDGEPMMLALNERLVLGGDHLRSQLRDYPTLARRYRHLLRGIPVFETYPRPGHGGHGHPAISMLDLDLHIDIVQASLRRFLRELRAEPPTQRGSDVAQLLQAQQRRNAPRRRQRLLICGGGCGSMGNAGHQLVPYLLRHILDDLGDTTCEIWGVVLGPHAFAGLTPFTRLNYLALMEGLDYLAVHGMRRSFINSLVIDSPTPPYDQIFVLDNPQLPGNGSVVSEAEYDSFLDQAALSLYLLLRGTTWTTLAAHAANPDQRALTESGAGQPRLLHTVRAVLAGVDRSALRDLLTDRIEHTLLETLGARLQA